MNWICQPFATMSVHWRQFLQGNRHGLTHFTQSSCTPQTLFEIVGQNGKICENRLNKNSQTTLLVEFCTAEKHHCITILLPKHKVPPPPCNQQFFPPQQKNYRLAVIDCRVYSPHAQHRDHLKVETGCFFHPITQKNGESTNAPSP